MLQPVWDNGNAWHPCVLRTSILQLKYYIAGIGERMRKDRERPSRPRAGGPGREARVEVVPGP
ncbi:MAG: hypothetical protein Kow0026_20430 [Oricola sp.]